MNRMYFRMSRFVQIALCLWRHSRRLFEAEASARNIASRTVAVDGVQLHYLTAGQGPAVILLHGYAETSRMWKPIIPVLAQKFTVVAPDLPGIGDSSIPAKIDMVEAARPNPRSRAVRWRSIRRAWLVTTSG